MKKLYLSIMAMGMVQLSIAQFHTLKIPQLSNRVVETQRLGVTDITVSYSSPSANERDVWNDQEVIPQNGSPIAWRAGANMNTTIEFSTDVFIEGNKLKKGKYGIHIIPNGHEHKVLFAHNSNLWGSYYLDMDGDVSLEINVKDTPNEYSEKLDFEFKNWSSDAVTISLEWADRAIPFKVAVDLNETVINSFREELRGVNTYHWQAWDDAARWCLNRNVNLEEALLWSNRSISGGYHGFAAEKNVTNLMTKMQLLQRLDKREEMLATLKDIESLLETPSDYNNTAMLLLRSDLASDGLRVSQAGIKKHGTIWYLNISNALSYYFLGNKKKAISGLNKVESMVPPNFKPRFDQIKSEVKKGTYKFPN